VDRINANTYPSTSFVYIKQSIYKLVVGNDRSQGVTIYNNNTILINLDRTASDDGKGLGERY
jgi:hypothetical protein